MLIDDSPLAEALIETLILSGFSYRSASEIPFGTRPEISFLSFLASYQITPMGDSSILDIIKSNIN